MKGSLKLGTDEDPEAKEIPPTRSPLTHCDSLQKLVDPALDPGNHGIDRSLPAVA